MANIELPLGRLIDGFCFVALTIFTEPQSDTFSFHFPQLFALVTVKYQIICRGVDAVSNHMDESNHIPYIDAHYHIPTLYRTHVDVVVDVAQYQKLSLLHTLRKGKALQVL